MGGFVFVLLNDNVLGDSMDLVDTRVILSEAKLLRDENVQFFGMDKEVVIYDLFKYFT